MYQKTIRNNSNIIILFHQTLNDVEHIYRDIAGFDMSYDEFKELCRAVWEEKHNYLRINRLEDKDGSRYRICNESNPNYKIFNPQTDPFQSCFVCFDVGKMSCILTPIVYLPVL